MARRTPTNGTLTFGHSTRVPQLRNGANGEANGRSGRAMQRVEGSPLPSDETRPDMPQRHVKIDALLYRRELTQRLQCAAAGMAAAQVARLTDSISETVRRYLLGVTAPSPQFLAAFCVSLGVSPEWLLCGTGPRMREGTRRNGDVSHRNPTLHRNRVRVEKDQGEGAFGHAGGEPTLKSRGVRPARRGEAGSAAWLSA